MPPVDFLAVCLVRAILLLLLLLLLLSLLNVLSRNECTEKVGR